jgi:arylsulfatase A-like enzyme
VRQNRDEVDFIRTQQLRMMRSVDDLNTALFDTLDRLDETENTLAIFLSDNGYMWFDHHLEGKRFPYSPSTRVPLYIRWPGHVHADAVDSRIAANVDLAPTIYDAIGIIPSYTPDGRSLLGPDRRSELLLEISRGGKVPAWNALRSKKFLYVEYESGELEYYDLDKDPWERHNLLSDRSTDNDPDTRMLHLMLKRYVSCQGATCP